MKKIDVQRIINEEMDRMSEMWRGARRGYYSSQYDPAGFPRGSSSEAGRAKYRELQAELGDEPVNPPPPPPGRYVGAFTKLYADPDLESVYGTDIETKLRRDVAGLSTYNKGYAGLGGEIIMGRDPSNPRSTLGGPHRWRLTKLPNGYRFDLFPNYEVNVPIVTGTDPDPIEALRAAAMTAIEGGLDFPGAEVILTLLDGGSLKPTRGAEPEATPMSELPGRGEENLQETRWAKMAGILRS